MTKCRECGAEGDGSFCAQCGAPLEAEERRCDECGAELGPEDRYCAGCGAAAGKRVRKPLTAYLPWILSGAALVLFSVAITLFVQDEAAPRNEGMPPTGSVIQGSEGTGSGGSGAGAGGAMPSASEIAQMDPLAAADRLYQRAMQEDAAGGERAGFFAGMARRAYERVAPDRWDADAHFHVGLLALVEGDSAAARERAETILSGSPDHLLGRLLAARAASTPEERSRHMERFRRAADTTDLASRSEYQAHATLIEDAAGGS